MAKQTRPLRKISIEAWRHDSATRRNNPTMELQSFLGDEEAKLVEIKFQRRFNPDKNPDLYARNRISIRNWCGRQPMMEAALCN